MTTPVKSFSIIKKKINDSSVTKISKDCQVLTLRDNELKDLPSSIQEFKSLTSLSVTRNLLAEVPVVLYKFVCLKRLDLSRNSITVIHPGISMLSSLLSLNLSSNEISEVPSEIGLLKNLRFLYLNYNKLERIPKEIGNLKDLVILDIRGNSMVSNDSGDLLGHISLRTFFGDHLLLVHADLGKTQRIERFLYNKLRRRAVFTVICLFATLILFLISHWLYNRKPNAI